MKSFLTVVKKPLQSKVLLAMKLTVLFILFLTLTASATGFGQDKISIRVKNTEIAGVLSSIEKQTNYRFLYNNDLKDIREKITLNVKDAPLEEVLDIMLKKTRLLYEVMNSNLIVIKEDPAAPAKVPDVVVHGKITGEGGVPLAGVSILVKGSSAGTTTDNSGNFTLTVPDANVTLLITSVGYDMKEVALGGKTDITIALVASTKVMEQVIVVGYGSQRKLDVTGSIAQVKGEEIAKQASTNPLSALQGKVAGVQITNMGSPGSSPQIRIRGVGTVYGNANPLYVVDGIWYDDISFLNPADIENLSVLKDASSEAIYGIRAANGVILINTKKGRNAKATVNYNGYVGTQLVTNDVKMASGPQYAQMVNELDAIGGVAPRYADPAGYGTTDWYHQILRNAITTNHQVAVSGGTERSNYNFSLGYLLQDGIVKNNGFERYTAKLQNDFQVFSALKLGYVVIGSMNKSTDIPGSIFHQLYSAVPIVPVYYADGAYGDPNDFSVTSSANFNPQVTLDYFNQKSKNYRLTGTVYGDLKFARHFTFHTNAGGDFGQNEVRNYNPVFVATLAQRNTVSKLSLTDGKTRNWIIENTLTYDNKFGDHNVRVLIGQGAQSYTYRESTASAENVPNNSEGDYYLTLGSNRNVTDMGVVSKVASYFGRVNYSFQNKYLLTATMRADGSSKFSGDNRWGYFPSVGVGWVLTEESFMANQKIFNNLKLRGSWGKDRKYVSAGKPVCT